jgi:hypothetical protein
MKAASDLTQERLTVVEISGSDGSSYRLVTSCRLLSPPEPAEVGSETRARTDPDLTGISIFNPESGYGARSSGHLASQFRRTGSQFFTHSQRALATCARGAASN